METEEATVAAEVKRKAATIWICAFGKKKLLGMRRKGWSREMKKRALSLVLALVMCLPLLCFQAAAKDEPETWLDNADTFSQPTLINSTFYISTPEELAWISYKVSTGTSFSDFNVILVNDIDLAGKLWVPIGGWDGDPLFCENLFSGKFFGQGHSIKNMTVNCSRDYAGFFGYLKNATVEGVSFENASVTGLDYTGVLAGYCYNINSDWLIRDCTVLDGSVNGQTYVGGLIGYCIAMEKCQLLDSSSAASVTGLENVGGAVGFATCSILGNLDISNCLASGAVTGHTSTGGLIGYMETNDAGHFTINNCSATGTVSGDNNTGGLIGSSNTFRNNTSSWSCGFQKVINCSAIGSVHGNDNVGGFVGVQLFESVSYNSNEGYSDFVSCYATGDVTGVNCVGGFVGNCSFTENNQDGQFKRYIYPLNYIVSCYSTGNVTAESQAGLFSGGGDCNIKNCFCNSDAVLTVAGSIVDKKAIFGVTDSGCSLTSSSELKMSGIINQLNAVADEDSLTWIIDQDLNNQGYPVRDRDDLRGWIYHTVKIVPQNGVYYVASAEQLAWISEQVALGNTFSGQRVVLTTDIDLGGRLWTPIGKEWYEFSGTFDGNYHKILNMEIGSNTFPSQQVVAGLFKSTSDAEIRNLTMENCCVFAEYRSSSILLGFANGNSTIISNCHISGVLSGYYEVGGLVGSGYTALTITDSSVNGTIIGADPVYARGDVGGLVGFCCKEIQLDRCFFSGTVSGTEQIGGLVGSATVGSKNQQCYALAEVSGQKFVGGLFGYLRNGSISECYASASVSGKASVGGIIGAADNCSLEHVYWNTDKTQSRDGIQLTLSSKKGIGEISDPSSTQDFEEMRKTTEQLQQQPTFSGWDFSAVWQIYAVLNDGMPSFQYQSTVAPVNATDVSLNPNQLTVAVGEVAQIAAALYPENASGDVYWKSENTSIATVSPAGLVSGISIGETVVTAVCNGRSAQCAVTVTKAETSEYIAGTVNASVSGNASVFSEVAISLSISNNKGFAGGIWAIEYDKEYLSLQSVRRGNAFSNTALFNWIETDQGVNVSLINPSNMSQNGELCTLLFAVNIDAMGKAIPVRIRPVVAVDEEDVSGSFQVSKDSVIIQLSASGDVDGNETVNISDPVKLMQYLARYKNITLTSVQKNNADVFTDSKLDTKDLFVLSNYIVKYPSTVIASLQREYVSSHLMTLAGTEKGSNLPCLVLTTDNEGEYTDISISIAGNRSGFTGFQFMLAIDPSILKPVSIQKGVLLSSGMMASNLDAENSGENISQLSSICVVYSGTNAIDEDGVLCMIRVQRLREEMTSVTIGGADFGFTNRVEDVSVSIPRPVMIGETDFTITSNAAISEGILSGDIEVDTSALGKSAQIILAFYQEGKMIYVMNKNVTTASPIALFNDYSVNLSSDATVMAKVFAIDPETYIPLTKCGSFFIV